MAILCVLLGTYGGVHLLRRMSDRTFRRVLYSFILLLGAYMLLHGLQLRG